MGTNSLSNRMLIGFIVVFLVHQFVEKILHFHVPFIDDYLDDFLIFPIILWMFEFEKRLLLKSDTYELSILDSVIITVVLSLFFEEVLPRWTDDFTRDLWDYLAYGFGWLVFVGGKK